MIKIIVGLTALQVINLSINVDYLAGGAFFDDTDSITEYVIEKIAGKNCFIDNNDDSDGCAQEKGAEKAASDDQWYFEHASHAKLCFAVAGNYRHTGIQPPNKPCRGHFYIEAPPPDAIQLYKRC